jgi:hypothetical protein
MSKKKAAAKPKTRTKKKADAKAAAVAFRDRLSEVLKRAKQEKAHPVTPEERRKLFLRAFVVCGSVSAAARAARVSRTEHYEWLEDPEYAKAFAEAQDEAVERLEAEVYKSATRGIAEAVIYQGKLCFEPLYDADGLPLVDPDTGRVVLSKTPLVVRKRNDVAAFFLLKALRPEKYRENAKIEHTGAGGAPIAVQVSFVKPGEPGE